MGVTTNSKPRYPDATDPADVPLDIQELATDLDEITYAQFTAPVTAPVVVASPAIVYQAVPIVIEFLRPMFCPRPPVLPSSPFGMQARTSTHSRRSLPVTGCRFARCDG